jgi:hypothetical protein
MNLTSSPMNKDVAQIYLFLIVGEVIPDATSDIVVLS